MQVAVDHEAVTPPIDLTTAQAIEIADYLRPRVKEPDTASCFECPFSGRVWLETLHFLPQAFIQSSRSGGQPAKDDKFTDHFNSKLGDLFPMTAAGAELPYGRRLKKRADLFVAVWKMLSQAEWRPMGYVSAIQSMLARVTAASDYADKIACLDWWRFVVNPYSIGAAVRGKLMETIMSEIRLALEQSSAEGQRNQEVLVEFLATAVYSLHALLLYNDRECDTESVNEEARWPANVGLKTLASIGQIVSHHTVKEYIGAYPLKSQTLNLQSAVAAFLARLSWNNDNKALLYQTMDGALLRAILRWASEEDLYRRARLPGYARSEQAESKDSLSETIRSVTRVHCATTMWNISKVPGNVTRLVADRKLFMKVLRMAVRQQEQPAVLRRILSCVQNLASERTMLISMLDQQQAASWRGIGSSLTPAARRPSLDRDQDELRTVTDHTEETLLVEEFRSVADFLEGLFEHVAGSDHVAAQVFGTIASFAYAGAVGSANFIAPELRRFLHMEGEPNAVSDFFRRHRLDEKVEFHQSSVKYEIARLLWCTLRMGVDMYPRTNYSSQFVHADEQRLIELVNELDVRCASVGVIYDDVPRRELHSEEIYDLFTVLQYDDAHLQGRKTATHRSPVIKLFAAWQLAHFSEVTADATKLASLGGFHTLANVARRIVDRLVEPGSPVRSPSAAQPLQTGECYLLTLKLLLHCLKNIAKQGDKLAHTIRGTDVLRNLASVFERIATLQGMELAIHTQRRDESAVFYARMGYKWFPLVDPKKTNLAGPDVKIVPAHVLPQPSSGAKSQGLLDVKAFDGSPKLRSLPVSEHDVRKTVLPSDIDMRRQVGSIFENMARHQEVLESLEPSNALEPFVELAIDGVVSQKVCLLALMRLHPSALYKPSTLAKLQQLLELILGADINLLDSASSSPPSTTRGHHSSSSAMDLGSELSAGDFDGAHVRSRANTFLSQVDLPTSILALRLANYVVSVFPEALHNLMTRTTFTPVERVQHRRLRRRLSRAGLVNRQGPPERQHDALAAELSAQGQILAIAALCRPLFGEALFKRFEKTLFLRKAEGREDAQMRLLHEWQYFFLELCGTVCDSLRRAGRVAGSESDEHLESRGSELPRADDAGELLTAEHFIAVKHMVELCQRCFQLVSSSSGVGSEDVLKVAFRCLGAVINLVEYVGSRSTWAGEEATERGSLVSNHDEAFERAGVLALVAPTMTTLYGVSGALRSCWDMLKKGVESKNITPLIFDHVLPIVLQFIRSSEALGVQDSEKKFSEDVRAILGTTLQVIKLLQPDITSGQATNCSPTGYETILANALRVLIAIVQSNAVKHVALQFSSSLTSVVNCLAYPSSSVFISEVMRTLAEERQGQNQHVTRPPQLLRGPSSNTVQGRLARIMEMFRRFPPCRTVRVLTTKLLSLLAKDVGTARQAVFPDEAADSRAPRADKADDDSAGDVDVSHRSWRGCIPLLWAMLRFGNLQEQEDALFVLYQLTQNNNLMKEVIGVIDDVKTLMRVGRSSEQSPALKCQLSKMLYELSSHPQLRHQMRRDGGLLLILQLNRSEDQEVRQYAELALQNFGKNSLEINVQLLSSSVRYIDRLIHLSPQGPKRSVGLMLLQPIHNVQLKEAIHGLVECAKHQDYAASMVRMDFERSELEETVEEGAVPRMPPVASPLTRQGSLAGNAPSLMQLLQVVFHVRDGDIQRNLLRILRALLWNCGDEFVQSLTPEQSELLTHNFLWLLQPLSIRAARIIVNACRSNIQTHPRRLLNNVLQRRLSAQTGREPQNHRRSSTAVSITFMSLSDDIEVPMAASERVALVYDAGVLDTTRLAAECIQIWAAQKVSVAISFAKKGLFDVIGRNLANADLWDIHHTIGDATISDPNAPGRKTTFVDSIVQLQVTLIRTVVQVKLSLCSLGTDEYDGQLLRALMFMQTYHFNESVQKEAFQALMLANVPTLLVAPRMWTEPDVLRWLCNAGLYQLAGRLLEEIQRLRHEIQSKDISEVSRRLAKGSASGRWFFTIQKLLQDSGWSADNRNELETIAGNLLLSLNYNVLRDKAIGATEQQARDFMSGLRVLHLQQLAIDAGFLFTESKDVVPDSNPGDVTESNLADSSLAVSGRRPYYITAQQRQVFMRLAQSVVNSLGYSPVGRDAWTTWWGMHYSRGWCFEACLPNGQSVTLRLIKAGTKPALPEFATEFVRHPPLPPEVERSLATHGLGIQVFYGSMVHHVLLEHVHEVLQRQGLEQDFTLLLAPPVPKLRFWRVEAQDNRRGRKVVLLEPSASLDKNNREQQDPEDYACSVIEVIPDVKYTSNIFVLDVVDMTNERDKDGCTSLIRAVMKNNMELARKLLEDPNVDPRIRDNEGRTALLHAVLLKHDDIVALLLNYLANIQKRLKQEGASNFVIASYQRSIDERDNQGRAALHHAVADKEERLNVVKQLLQAKAQVNVRDNEGNTPLHLACQYGHVDVVKNLLKYNANTTAANAALQTPVHVAAGHLHTRIVAILLKENSEHMIRAEDNAGATALHYAVKAGQKLQQERDDHKQDEGEEEVVRLLLRHGADLHDLDKDGRTPLDFRLYYHQKYQEIRDAVIVDLEYRVQQLSRLVTHVLNYPRYVFIDCCKGGRLRYETLEQREEQRRFQRLADKSRASERLFASARIQEAVDVEWRHGGCRKHALKAFLYYCFYLLIFTLATVYSTGQNKANGYYMAEGIRKTLLETPISNGQAPNPVFDDITTVPQIWEWAEGPLLQSLTRGSNITWNAGQEQRSFGEGHYVNNLDKVVGKLRVSQWRTAEDSCTVASGFGDEPEYCFADYCPSGELCFPTEDSETFGPGGLYHHKDNVHAEPVPGRFATYSTKCFVEEISQDPDQARVELEALEQNNWIDVGTRAVLFEMNLYNPTSNRFIYGQMMFEIPAGSNVVPLDTMFAFQGFSPLADVSNVQSYEDLVSAILDIVLIFCVIVYITAEIRECVESSSYYFLSIYNYVDWLLILFHIIAFATTIVANLQLGALDYDDNDSYVDIRGVAEAEQWKRLLSANALILAWFKLLEPTQRLVSEFYILVKMIILMLGKLVQSYAPLLTIVFLAWCFARYSLLSQIELTHSTLSLTFATQYPEALGEFTLQDITDTFIYQKWRLAAMTVFIVITVLVMLNLLISLLNELYEKLKQKAKADWCREQAVQLYQYDERKQHSTRKWFKQLYQNMTSGAAGGASSASASGAKSQRRDSVNAEFGLSPALAINVANSTSFDGVATDVKEEDIDEPGVRPTKRLQHLQERAARVGRAYFDDDSRMHTVGPLLSSLKAWTLNANAPPLELLGVLEQLLRDTLRNTPRLKETLKEGALRTVTLVLEAIENNKLTNPVGSRHPVHDTWRTAQRCCLRCMYRLTTLPTETIATNDAQAAEWSDHLYNHWGGAEATQLLTQLLLNDMADSRTQRLGGHKAGRAKIKQAEYQLDVLQVLANLLDAELIASEAGCSLGQPSAIQPNIASIILRIAANEGLDDLHRDLALTATKIAAKYCMPQLADDLQRLEFLSGADRVEDDHWRSLQAVTICKRIADMGEAGVDAIVSNAQTEKAVLFALVKGLKHVIATPADKRSKTENSVAQRIMRTLLLITQHGRIGTEDVEGLTTAHLQALVDVLMEVVESEVRAEREHAMIGTSSGEQILPVDDETDIAIAAIEALGNLLQAYDLYASAAGINDNFVKAQMRACITAYPIFVSMVNGSFSDTASLPSHRRRQSDSRSRGDVLFGTDADSVVDLDDSPSLPMQHLAGYRTFASTMNLTALVRQPSAQQQQQQQQPGNRPRGYTGSTWRNDSSNGVELTAYGEQKGDFV